MATFLLDTCVIIDVLNDKRDRPALIRELLRDGHLLACCAINLTEIHAGLRPHEQAATHRFLESLQYYPVSQTEARLAGDLKRDYRAKGTTLNLGDVIVAAVAISNRLTLLTDNVKDFPMKELALFPLP